MASLHASESFVTPVNTTGDTDPFTEICDGSTMDTTSYKAATYLAGITEKDGTMIAKGLICDPGRTPKITGMPATGILAECLCPDGSPPTYLNTCL